MPSEASAPALIERGTPAFRRASLALFISSLVVFGNLYAIHPLLPLISTQYGVSTLQASNAFTLTSLTLGLSLLAHGPLSDAFGRRAPLIIGLVVTALLTLGMAFSTSFDALLWMRMAQGVALGVLPATAVAYLGDSMNRQALIAAVGLYIGGNTLGGAGGRVLGGFIADHFGLQTVFLTLGSASLLCALAVALLLPAPSAFRPQRLSLRGSLGTFASHLRNRALLPAYLVGGLGFMVFINLYTFTTFRLSAPPWLLGASSLGLLFLTYMAGTLSASLSGRIKPAQAAQGMAVGVGIFMVGCLITLAEPLWLIITGLIFNAFGFFLTHSLANSWVNQHAAHGKASSSSLYSVFYYLGAAVGIYYLAPFWRIAGWPAVVGGSLLVLVISLLLIRYLHRGQQRA
ncbi:major facilitator transporter [Pseudomonas saudimassiliensis]|uniref:Major facilitator transporter n=1 Tax=Pseudomonas saudimassiliensis TaxID=1461581 RepID=A0A078MN66_9PSED|nr:MFS transporter [Pseudomonas saudimassiliensis]CEA06251.1 major facilitator transporter [Pseudomonas saudimassiliensis]CEF27676.1 major facilitator transporter [Pseudomonas saudimassiliensis]